MYLHNLKKSNAAYTKEWYLKPEKLFRPLSIALNKSLHKDTSSVKRCL